MKKDLYHVDDYDKEIMDELTEKLSVAVTVASKTMEMLANSDFPKNLARFIVRFEHELTSAGVPSEKAFEIVKNYTYKMDK